MSYSVQTAKNDLQGVLHGTQLNQIQNIDGVFDRAARELLLQLDPQETKRTVEFANPIFSTVFDYPIAADVKGNKIIDIRPQVRRLPVSVWSQAYNQAFDIAKQNIFASTNMFTMNFNTGIKTIRINAPFLNTPSIINEADGISTNGTWVASGTATNLTVNNTNFVSGSGSLEFDVTVGTGVIANSTMTAINLSNVENQSSLFTWVYVPTGSSLTSVTLFWGSSTSDYWSKTVSLNQQGVAFQNGWNLCQFDWATATPVGSPDSTAINYLSVRPVVSSNQVGCKIDYTASILGTVLEYEYYSKYLFRDVTTGAFQETVTADSNLINLDTESYNVFFNLLAYYAVQQQQGLDAEKYDGVFFKGEYENALARYKEMYKSETQKPQTSYYSQPKTGYSRYIGRWYP